jgi:hypothetical protein
MGSWYQPGTHGVPRQGRRGEAVPVRRACGERPANPTPEPTTSDPQGVAVLPGGALLPAPSGPHQQGTPPSEFPGSKQGPMGSWQHGGTPLDSRTLGIDAEFLSGLRVPGESQ